MIRALRADRLAALVALMVLMPLIWMVSVSFMAPGEAAAISTAFVPSHPTLDQLPHLVRRLRRRALHRNSILVSTPGDDAGAIVRRARRLRFRQAALYRARGDFPGAGAAMVVPGQIGMLPLFLELKAMGLVNSYAGALVPWLAGFSAFSWCGNSACRSRPNCSKRRGSTARANG